MFFPQFGHKCSVGWKSYVTSSTMHLSLLPHQLPYSTVAAHPSVTQLRSAPPETASSSSRESSLPVFPACAFSKTLRRLLRRDLFSGGLQYFHDLLRARGCKRLLFKLFSAGCHCLLLLRLREIPPIDGRRPPPLTHGLSEAGLSGTCSAFKGPCRTRCSSPRSLPQ
jgi:hypothetical protein